MAFLFLNHLILDSDRWWVTNGGAEGPPRVVTIEIPVISLH